MLLIDPSDQYGCAWATLSMDQVPMVARPAEELAGGGAEAVEEGCKLVPIDSEGSIAISNLVQYTDGTEQGASPQVLVDLTPKVRRQRPVRQAATCLDRRGAGRRRAELQHPLHPPPLLPAHQVLYQAEELVQLLVQCKAHNYVEFKLVESWCACALRHAEQPLLPVSSPPCCRLQQMQTGGCACSAPATPALTAPPRPHAFSQLHLRQRRAAPRARLQVRRVQGPQPEHP